MLCLFRWLYYVKEFVYAYAFFLFLFICLVAYYESLVFLGILPYLLSCVCMLINIPHPEYAQQTQFWESAILVYICQFQVLWACKLLGMIWSWFHFNRAWGDFHGHTWHIMNCHAIWLIITHSVLAISLLSLLTGGNTVPFHPFTVHCCPPMVHMCLCACYECFGQSIVLNWHFLHEYVLQLPSCLLYLFT